MVGGEVAVLAAAGGAGRHQVGQKAEPIRPEAFAMATFQ
jgi:hypothetical protein